MTAQMGQKLAYGDQGPHFMVTRGAEVELAYAPDGEGFVLGKRYAAEASGVTVLCTKAGPGQLSVDGEPLALLAQKPLPSSD